MSLRFLPVLTLPRGVLLVSLVAGLLPGCLQLGLGSGSNGGSGSPSEPEDPDVEEGTCDAWKVSYCKAVARCSSFERRQECEDDVGYVICFPDADTAGCQKEIEAALDDDACEELPTDCGPNELADRTEPFAACRDIYEAICEWNIACTLFESLDGCITRLETDAPCSDYTAALYPNVEPCIEAYRRLSCGDSPPAECDHVLRKTDD